MSDLVRIITCGSVDDGKSTLIGRLLYESRAVLSDQMSTLEADSRRFGTRGDDVDLALLLDGLQAEREQGITIDVAYRHFATDRRRFILADTPGHEQYTRNMVTGASTADIAVILVDARKGILPQTRRHSLIVSLLGIHHVIVAINKMDLVDWSEEVFSRIEGEYRTLATDLGTFTVTVIPVSALTGDNVLSPSQHMPWYSGLPLLPTLETLDVSRGNDEAPLRFPVQWINRPNPDFRGLSGTIASGRVHIGQRVQILPSGVDTSISQILTVDGHHDLARTGDAVTIVLDDDVDVARGDLVSAVDRPAHVADQFLVDLVWMHDEPMLPGRSYLLKLNTRTVIATFNRPKYVIDPATLSHVSADSFALNDVGACTVSTVRPIPFDPYSENRTMGGFIVIDRHTNATVGAGMIRYALRRSHNIQWQSVTVDKASRIRSLGHRPAIVWLTGLSGTGKSTIGNALEYHLHSRGAHTYFLDGDNLRHGLNKDLGFTPGGRVENIRRAGEVAKLMVDAGLIVICAFISPYAAERDLVRNMVEPGEFFEIFVDTSIDVLESRDPKGLYAKARSGAITNFTGIDAPYERPEHPDLRLDTTVMSVSDSVSALAQLLDDAGIHTPG